MRFSRLVLLMLVLVAGCTSAQAPVNVETGGTTNPTSDTAAVRITSSGFSPKTITVTPGTTVTWTNDDTAAHWVASNVHPTHTVYPGSGIGKCDTAQEPAIFDACKNIPAGGTYAFTFTEKGTWGYHDHLNAGTTGTVVVQ
ncbi:MAG: cupredoxin domain-containing protein [Candidatus Aenigmarchaeota archaeon]|nr:cupredoxin domain-containing protein [Candidatus Aenigmarchaeota archaeon]